ncbi:protein HEAT INTOLERANT 4-like [Silene latifolia]|uniref:protein HEAT INTOLERANT 4-like n=1 Tax=Silene latifolia TaxID=37657 RepID=UPI003D7803A7
MAKRKLAQRKGAAAKKKNAQVEDKTIVDEQISELEQKDEQIQEKSTEQVAENHQKLKKDDVKEDKKDSKRPNKRSKPNPEPEYFEDTRNLEDLWKQVFPVGTEWDQLHLMYQHNWDFTNLENAFEEGGDLHGKKVYLFGCSEPQMVPVNGEMRLTLVPAVVAVVSPFPPSDKIGINSVQREAEEIVPMKRMKMDWVPYIPFENRDRMVERLKSEIFILGCTQRRSALRHLREERVKKFEYCLPYFYNPFLEDELEQSTEVTIVYDMEPKPVLCEFDWELDELEEFADKLISDDALPSEHKEDFKNHIKEKVREAKKTNREAREARKKALEEMSAETKAAFENIKFYKFYPVATPNSPDVSQVKSPFINRYYGKAHKVL